MTKKKMINIFSEFISFRFLISMFVIRDLKLRYKQTILGIIWVVIQPLLPLTIFTCIFGKVVKLDSQGIPYLLFAFAGLVPWLLFSESVNRCSNCLVAEERLLTKVYFPKIILPLSKFSTVFIDFLIGMIIFFLFLIFYKISFSLRLFFFPLILLITIFMSLGVGIFFSALNVYFRDFRIITPFLLQIGMYASPVIYSSYMVPEKFRFLFFMNPMVGFIESFRWVFFESILLFPTIPFIISIIFSFTFFYFAIIIFRKVEMYFADII
jgi:lipopolysaccharide transport system permease protein